MAYLPITFLRGFLRDPQLTQPMAKLGTFWDYMFSRKNKPFKLLSQGPGRLSESK